MYIIQIPIQMNLMIPIKLFVPNILRSIFPWKIKDNFKPKILPPVKLIIQISYTMFNNNNNYKIII